MVSITTVLNCWITVVWSFLIERSTRSCSNFWEMFSFFLVMVEAWSSGRSVGILCSGIVALARFGVFHRGKLSIGWVLAKRSSPPSKIKIVSAIEKSRRRLTERTSTVLYFGCGVYYYYIWKQCTACLPCASKRARASVALIKNERGKRCPQLLIGPFF